jgi:myo-inositol 2-dehydrogenase / D-chiro-inositol 1-dehydrogenase
MTIQNDPSLSRRQFVKATAATSLAVGAASVAHGAYAGGSDRIRIGLIGCGGRGTGAALNAMQGDPGTEIYAMADLFPDRLASSFSNMRGSEWSERITATDTRRFVGWDAYEDLLSLDDVDSVILATPPQFRPVQFTAAINAGKHVFFEKPVGVDAMGIRKVLAAADVADRKGLKVVAGTQRRHEGKYLELMRRIHRGDIGEIVAGNVYWNMGGLWMKPRQAEWSDMEWQLRNWLYFTWLSGDHITEQHVHNLDVANWAIGAHPESAMALAGRQVRTGKAYGNVFDHFSVEYVYPGDVRVTSNARQINGCAGRVDEYIVGTKGRVYFGRGRMEITGQEPYTVRGNFMGPYVQEHTDLYNAIRSGSELNEARNVATSTLTAIMGRMSAYTGKLVTWEQALNSKLDLSPPAFEFGSLPVRPVSVPGKTKLV